MSKYLFCFGGALLCLLSVYSCGTSKITVQQNEIDSVIRRVNPTHNCGCDYKDKTVQFPIVKNGSINDTYFWQSVYVTSGSKRDFLEQSVKIRQELVTLIPTLKNYKILLIEFRLNTTQEADTAFSSTNIGTSYYILNGCNGYAENKTHEDLLKATKTKKGIISLCKTNN